MDTLRLLCLVVIKRLQRDRATPTYKFIAWAIGPTWPNACTTAGGEADGDRELPVVLCTLNPYCAPHSLAGCVGFLKQGVQNWLGTILIFVCESAQNALFHTKYLKNILGKGHRPHSPTPDAIPAEGDIPPQTIPPRRLGLDAPRWLKPPYSKNSCYVPGTVWPETGFLRLSSVSGAILLDLWVGTFLDEEVWFFTFAICYIARPFVCLSARTLQRQTNGRATFAKNQTSSSRK